MSHVLWADGERAGLCFNEHGALERIQPISSENTAFLMRREIINRLG